MIEINRKNFCEKGYSSTKIFSFQVFLQVCQVEFTEEKEIEVVPYIWLREGENVAGHHLDHHRKNKLL